jgi:Ca2+-binding RTX toxin-like protein
MSYSAIEITSLARGIVPYVDAKPIKYLWVSPSGSDGNSGSESSPFKSISAAVKAAGPGTAVMVKSGTYNENVNLDGKSGTADKPIWVVSADGPGKAKVVAATSSKPVFHAYGEDNLVIKGFEMVGGTEGVKLTQGGHDLSNMTTNVVIQDNIIHGQSIDGIKTSQSVNFVIAGNTVYDVQTQEGIDNVYMRNSIIANNEVYDVRGLSGIVVKGGSQNVKVLDNYVHNVPDGILVGGWSTGQGSTFPSGITYEARNVLVEGNWVTNVAKHAVNVYGGIDSKVASNLLQPNSNYYAVVNVGTDNNGYVSKNMQFVDNIVQKDNWLAAQPGSVSVNTGNVKTGAFDTSLTGPNGVEVPTAPAPTPVPPAPVPDPVQKDPAPAPPAEAPPPGDLVGTWKTSAAPTKSFVTGTGSQTLNGTTGHDFLNGGSGLDRMVGGKGDDTYVVGSALDVVAERAGEGTDTVLLWDRSFVMPANVENLVIRTGDGATVTDNGMNNMLTGGAGKDVFAFAANHGNDLIKGFQVGKDLIRLDPSIKASGLKLGKNAAGDLVLEDAGGSITFSGVDAKTSLGTLLGSSTVPTPAPAPAPAPVPQQPANPPASTVPVADAGAWKTSAAPTKSFVTGTGSQTLNGTTGHDFLNGGSGLDRMVGGKGDDTYVVGSALDAVVERAGEGTDTVLLWDRSFVMPANVENLTIRTADGATVTDNGMDNILVGGAGRDVFAFTANHGDDLVKGFQVGRDALRFDASVKTSDFTVARNGNGDMVLQHDDMSVTLTGVSHTTPMADLF